MSARNSVGLFRKSARQQANRSVSGIWPAYQDFRSLLLWEGRLLTEEDEKEGRRVVLLGSAARDQLFSGQPDIGETITNPGHSLHRRRLTRKEKAEFQLQRTRTTTFCLHRTRRSPATFPPPEKPGITRGFLDNIVFEVWRSGQPRRNVAKSAARWGACTTSEALDVDALFSGHDGWRQKQLKRIFDMITLFFACVAIHDAVPAALA